MYQIMEKIVYRNLLSQELQVIYDDVFNLLNDGDKELIIIDLKPYQDDFDLEALAKLIICFVTFDHLELLIKRDVIDGVSVKLLNDTEIELNAGFARKKERITSIEKAIEKFANKFTDCETVHDALTGIGIIFKCYYKQSLYIRNDHHEWAEYTCNPFEYLCKNLTGDTCYIPYFIQLVLNKLGIESFFVNGRRSIFETGSKWSIVNSDGSWVIFDVASLISGSKNAIVELDDKYHVSFPFELNGNEELTINQLNQLILHFDLDPNVRTHYQNDSPFSYQDDSQDYYFYNNDNSQHEGCSSSNGGPSYASYESYSSYESNAYGDGYFSYHDSYDSMSYYSGANGYYESNSDGGNYYANAALDDEDKELIETYFALISKKKISKGDNFVIDFVTYEQKFSFILDEIRKEIDEATALKKGGPKDVRKGTEITLVMTSPNIKDLSDNISFVWEGKYVDSQLCGFVPNDYEGNNVILNIDVIVFGVTLVNIKTIIDLEKDQIGKLDFTRVDMKDVFFSYSSEDRETVLTLKEGMEAICPNINCHIDIAFLHAGDDWFEKIKETIDMSDALFLIWSENAYQSVWVKEEWQYALKTKGINFIKPISISLIDKERCPVPKELASLNFTNINTYLKYGNK